MAQSNPFTIDTAGNPENPEPPSNPDMGQNPQSTYKINLALIKKLQSDRQAVAEAGQEIENQAVPASPARSRGSLRQTGLMGAQVSPRNQYLIDKKMRRHPDSSSGEDEWSDSEHE